MGGEENLEAGATKRKTPRRREPREALGDADRSAPGDTVNASTGKSLARDLIGQVSFGTTMRMRG